MTNNGQEPIWDCGVGQFELVDLHFILVVRLEGPSGYLGEQQNYQIRKNRIERFAVFLVLGSTYYYLFCGIEG